jgi:SAM-dependent methyltransferase
MTTRFLGGFLFGDDNSKTKTIAGASQRPACIVCGGDTAKQFAKESLGEEVGYFRCLECGHLTASNFSTDGLYDNEQYTEAIDIGWQERGRRTVACVTLLCRLPGIFLSRHSRIGDCGCGLGVVVDALRHRGYIAFGYEPFPARGQRSAHLFSDWSAFCEAAGQFDLVICIEVLEHLQHPDELLKNITSRLSSGGYMLVSTETFNPRIHGQDWYYLNPTAGHVSIYTEASLQRVMGRHGFYPVMRVDGLVWLFRYLPESKPGAIEKMYLELSQLRLRHHIRLGVLPVASGVLCGK